MYFTITAIAPTITAACTPSHCWHGVQLTLYRRPPSFDARAFRWALGDGWIRPKGHSRSLCEMLMNVDGWRSSWLRYFFFRARHSLIFVHNLTRRFLALCRYSEMRLSGRRQRDDLSESDHIRFRRWSAKQRYVALFNGRCRREPQCGRCDVHHRPVWQQRHVPTGSRWRWILRGRPLRHSGLLTIVCVRARTTMMSTDSMIRFDW